MDVAQLSSPTATQDPPATRRKSGRQIRKPDLFAATDHNSSGVSRGSNGSGKRKHAATGPDAESENEDNVTESSSDEEDEDEADEEELKERRRTSRTKKPAVKRPKMANGTGKSLAIRPATAKASKAAKVQKARSRKSQANAEGLYADVFGRGLTGEAAAAEWLSRYNRNNVAGMCEMVNFILKCTGCDLKVDVHDIEDVDNVPGKLGDLQEEYQAANVADFPLVSRLKQYAAFRPVLTEFFDALTKSMHSSSVLYTDTALIENIQLWATTMSSAGIRPFRHTATTISLTLMTALCEVARELLTTVTHSRKQLEAEQKKKSVNKGRVGSLQTRIKEVEANLELIDTLLKDQFDAVFVHRYRDIDARIRAESIAALGLWMTTYRKMFFEGQYLRYLGWVLSDTIAHTRAEVVKQLIKLFKNKDNIAGLRAFTERFRPRIVEMATRDADPGVRSTTIELTDILRDVGYLEPDDIDAIGKLIFDVEPRVRKAVAKFFVSNIYDVYENSTEELATEMKEVFPNDDPEDFELPQSSWIKYRCLADVLALYTGNDDHDDDDHGTDRLGTASKPLSVPFAEMDSRYSLAAQSIYPHMTELHDWEALAGYLLYDHSQIAEVPAEDESADAVKSLFKLSEGQENILLEVLDAAVKLHLLEVAESDIDKKGRKTKAKKDEVQERQESIAHSLTQIIPRLLNKFGSVPDAALPVLRLEHLLNLDLVQAMQQDSAAYSTLLDDINKQFMSHSNQLVLAEASLALLHARSFEELKEATEGKLQELWEDSVGTLQNLLKDENLDSRGTISRRVLAELSNTILRISNLASISDCVVIFETRPTKRASKKKGATSAVDPLGLLLELAKRGVPDDDTTEDLVVSEDELALQVNKTILFYFMWKVQSITSTRNATNSDAHFLESLAYRRDSFVETLVAIISSRKNLDAVRLSAIMTLLDLETLFSTLRHLKGKSMSDETGVQLQSLVHEIAPEMQSMIFKTHDLLVKSFAKLSRRTLEAAEDDEPDSEEEDEDDDNAPPADKEARARATLVMEHKLCELTGKLVVAIIARVLDASGPRAGVLRQRLLRNRNKLGMSYRDVVANLEDPREKLMQQKMKGKKAEDAANANQTGKTDGKGATGAKSAELVLPEDDIEDDENDDGARPQDEDDDENLRERGLVEEVDEEEEEEQEVHPEKPAEPNEENEDDDAMGD